MDITLTDSQNAVGKLVRAWYRAGHNPTFYLAGYAGTGKTTIIPNILNMCKLHPSEVAFCAPTGKAAQVLTKKMFGFYGDKEFKAKTIHSWIYTPKRMRVEALAAQIENIEAEISFRISSDDTRGYHSEFEDLSDQKLQRLLAISTDDLNKAYTDNDGPTFSLNVHSKIVGKKLIVVDEVSMVGSDIASDLKQFGIPILAVGDPFQLQPVKDSRGLAVGEPDAFMTEIHRQAKDNPIIALATKIRNGEHVGYGSMGEAVRIIKRRDDDVTLAMDRDCQVLVGMNKTRFQLTKKIRDSLGYKEALPQPDESLLITKNSRTSPNLVNGTPVWCVKAPKEMEDGAASFNMTFVDEDDIEYRENVLQCLFEHHAGGTMAAYSATPQKITQAKLRGVESVDFAWAITGHKSQGSQWDEVIVHDESNVFREEAMNWLYTCVTRAAERLTIVR